jgi:hypothetical protein
MLVFNYSFSQNTIEWSDDYKLKISDYASPQSEVNSELDSYTIFPGAQINMNFQMSNYEFMFTKNFNSKVNVIFSRNLAAIIAPDSLIAYQLVKYGQFSFDLRELYARKLRKEIYEKKGAFSGINMFEPLYNKLSEEMNVVDARILKSTNFGKDLELLGEEHKKVLLEIDTYSDFCKDCKPPKKKKKKG